MLDGNCGVVRPPSPRQTQRARARPKHSAAELTPTHHRTPNQAAATTRLRQSTPGSTPAAGASTPRTPTTPSTAWAWPWRAPPSPAATFSFCKRRASAGSTCFSAGASATPRQRAALFSLARARSCAQKLSHPTPSTLLPLHSHSGNWNPMGYNDTRACATADSAPAAARRVRFSTIPFNLSLSLLQCRSLIIF
jgi:hypothetical protein